MKKILLAEDDRFLRRACEASLRQRGYVVLSAADGEEALQIARAERPDVILLDMLMPKRTGLQVLQALRQDAVTCSTPVLVISNSSREADIETARALGIVDYLVKANLSLKDLGDRVARLLGD